MLQNSAQPPFELVAIVLGIVDPRPDGLVHGFPGEIASRGNCHGAGDPMGRFADAGRRYEQAEMTAQQGTTEDPTTARQRGKVEAIEEFRRRLTASRGGSSHASGLGTFHLLRPPKIIWDTSRRVSSIV